MSHPRPFFCQRIGLLAVVCFLYLFQLPARSGDYLINAWDMEQGLPDDFVTAVAQTPEGYIWIGTYSGVARFDGVHFTIFKPDNTPQLAHARIEKLFLDAQGTLWINTHDGSLTSWRNGVFTREWNGKGKDVSEAWFVSSNSRRIAFAFRDGLLISRSPVGTNDWDLTNPPGLPPGAYYREDNTGTLWCSTLDGKLWRKADDHFELMSQGNNLRGREIHWLATDLSGRIWVATEKELAMWNGKSFQDMLPAGESELNVASIFFTRDGGILVAADGRLRKILNGRWASEFKALPDLQQQPQLRPVLCEDREGGLWQLSRGMGIIRLEPGNASQQITVADGLPSDHTTCWLQDCEDNIWLGLGHGGLAQLRKKHFDVLGMPPGQPGRPAVSVCEDKSGALWVGTYGGGLNCWRNGTATNFGIPGTTAGGFVFSVCPDPRDNQLWLSAGMEDLFLFKGNQSQPGPTNVHGIKSMLLDSQNRLWMGRKDGVSCWQNGVLHEWNSHNGSIARPVRVVIEDLHADIWLGSDDGSIYRFSDGRLQAFPLPEFSAQQAVWSLLADADGSLWIGTSDGGLLHFESGRFTRFTSNDGLPDNLICQILDDNQGNLWLGSHHGIFRVNKFALRNHVPGKSPPLICSAYGRDDGLPTLECSDMYQPSAWHGRSGKLWFATAKGVVAVQPDEVPINARPPPVVMESLFADGKLQRPATGRRPDKNAAIFVIPPGAQNFEFRYTALSLIDSEKINFRYQLEGFDSSWVNAGTRRWVQYSYLKPGNYRFRVMACNNDGFWNEAGTAVGVEVLPHFWETWWFRAMLVLTFVTVIVGVVRHVSRRELRQQMQRLARQRDIEQDRARIARDLHDQLGSGLTRINLLNELLLGEPPDQLPARVTQITGVTCELMREMDEMVWAVNPKNDTLDNLMSYLCDFADEFLRPAGMSLRLRVPTPLPAWHLTSEVRHNLFLAVKEILNNIVKHSGAREVMLELRLNPEAAILIISDNGCGLQVKSPAANPVPGLGRTNGNGLENLQKRAAMVGGRCRISSEPGQGTRIEIFIPAPMMKEEK